MPKSPKGQKRPADVIGNAMKVMRTKSRHEKEYNNAKRDVSKMASGARVSLRPS